MEEITIDEPEKPVESSSTSEEPKEVVVDKAEEKEEKEEEVVVEKEVEEKKEEVPEEPEEVMEIEPVEEIPKTILETLEDKILDIITGEMDLKALLKLAKSCKSLRQYVFRKKLPPVFSSLSCHVELQKCSISHRFGDEKLEIVYKKHPDGCLESWGENEKLLENDHYVDVFTHDFALILRHQSGPLEELVLKQESNGVEKLDTTEFPKILRGLEEALKARDSPLPVEKLEMDVKNQDQVMQVLPHLTPGTLQSIFFRIPPKSWFQLPLELDEITETEQWKGASEIECYRHVRPGMIDKFKHFKRIGRLTIENILVYDLKRIRDACLASPTLKYIYLHYPCKQGVLLLDSFGIPHMPGVYEKDVPQKWHFEYPSEEETDLLRILHPTFNNFVEFEKVDASEVPPNARVLGRGEEYQSTEWNINFYK
uniref:FTH domain-containing protein n=1 Tax=Caenorhabditis tropicalis TaxID=1561998 RepID=A0A1I7UID2_9PELO